MFFPFRAHPPLNSLFQERKPSWWIVLADEKSNRVVVPPLKITDIPNARLPHADADEALLEHDYRAYKIQFQSPPNVGMFTWKVYVVSDTFVGGEVTRDITVSSISPKSHSPHVY